MRSLGTIQGCVGGVDHSDLSGVLPVQSLQLQGWSWRLRVQDLGPKALASPRIAVFQLGPAPTGARSAQRLRQA